MNYDNYFAGGAPSSMEPEFVNAMGRGAKTPAPKPMTMADFQQYWATLSPEEQALLANHVQEINFGEDKGAGGGNPIQKILSMFKGEKGKTGEDGTGGGFNWWGRRRGGGIDTAPVSLGKSFNALGGLG